MSGIMQMVANNVAQAASADIPTPTVYLDALNYAGSGTTWTAENGSNATLVNTPTFAAPAPTYFSFAPASLEEATLPALSSLNNWTIEAWFRVTSSLTGQVTAVVCDQWNLTNALNFSMGTNNAPTDYRIRIGFFNGIWRNTAGFAPTLNTWYHMIGTYDGTTMKEYVNGTLTSSASSLGTSSSGGIGLRIARRWDETATSTNYFPGDVGLTRIWNSALPAAQVQELYNENVSRFSNSVVTSNLVAYFDAGLVASYPGTGTTWFDLSGQGNDIVMQNSGSISYTASGGGYFTLASNGYFNRATTTGIPTGTSAYTMSAWVQLGSSWGGQGIIGIGSSTSGNQTNQFRTISTNGLVNYWYGNDLVATSSLSPASQWFNCVAQWDGTTRKIWVNGTEIASAGASGLNVTSSLLQVGATNIGGSEPLQGNIGQASIYNRALTSTEIQQNYTAIRGRYGV
jgi:hypothetical protein